MEHLPDNISDHVAERLARGPVKDIALGTRIEKCEFHGEYITTGMRYGGRREIWTSCQKCKEAAQAADLRDAAQRKARADQLRIEAMLHETAIPARFIGRTFESFNASTEAQRAALKVVREFAENFELHRKRGNGLVLSGMPGTGKTHLAAAVLQAIMPANCGFYTTCMGVIRSVRGTWRKDSDKSEAQVLQVLGTVPLLVIDEIGVQYGTDGEQTILFDVLDRRYRDMMPTILLTNQDSTGFKSFIGERSYDRLREATAWVAFDWPSYRPQARREAA